jgi:8-oxo-dGTP pyrophosphatase MutT (NUDIX family)
MQLQVGVKILLKNHSNKFLLLLRNSKHYPEAGESWDIVGGRIQPGTSLLENLKREIKEETGLDYSGEPKLITAQDIIVHRCPDGENYTDKNLQNQVERHVVRLTYIGEIQGEPIISQEHLEARWFSLSEMKNLKNLDKYLKEILLKLTCL